MSVEQAAIRKFAWKPDLAQYVTALLSALLTRPYGNNDDVAEALQPLDKTTVGAGIRVAIDAGCIVPLRASIESAGIFGGMRKSTRPGCNGHRNQLYQVVAPVAREWLTRHGVAISLSTECQMDFPSLHEERRV
jgi:hypothetical protein